jgi:uncharacterized OsmC-like protein
MTMEQEFAISLDWQDGYRFEVDFGQDGVPRLQTDEGAPLGDGTGPSPARLLAAAVGNCMSASLKFCLDRSRVELLDMRVRVDGSMERNERGRFRIASLRVRLEPTVAEADRERLGRCLDVFEDFCIVGQSVRQGIAIAVDVAPQPAVATVMQGGMP